MKKRRMYYGIAVIAMLLAGGLALAGCPNNNDTSGGGGTAGTSITYTVFAVNNTAGDLTTGIGFEFSDSINLLDVAEDNITIGGKASKGSGVQFNRVAGNRWTLSPVTISGPGDATVSISKAGIEAGQKTVPVITNIITYTVTQSGGAAGTGTTTGFVFTFSSNPSVAQLGLTDITVNGTGIVDMSKATFSGNVNGPTRTLAPVRMIEAGTVTISINRSGIETEVKNVPVFINYSPDTIFEWNSVDDPISADFDGNIKWHDISGYSGIDFRLRNSHSPGSGSPGIDNLSDFLTIVDGAPRVKSRGALIIGGRPYADNERPGNNIFNTQSGSTKGPSNEIVHLPGVLDLSRKGDYRLTVQTDNVVAPAPESPWWALRAVVNNNTNGQGENESVLGVESSLFNRHQKALNDASGLVSVEFNRNKFNNTPVAGTIGSDSLYDAFISLVVNSDGHEITFTSIKLEYLGYSGE